MIINDNGREYNLDKLSGYSSNTQGIIRRLIYLRYVAIRDLLSNSCCNKLRASIVKEKVQDINELKRIENVFNFSEEEIIFYVEYSIDNFPMVR